MRNIWFVSDAHCQHKNVLKYEDRPFSSIEEWDEHFVEQWNRYVKPGDQVYNLGDFIFQWRGRNEDEAERIVSRLQGEHFLILGNHDRPKLYTKTMLRHFAWIKERETIKIKTGGETIRILLDHYPLRSWHSKFDGVLHVHGHTHGKLNRLPGTLDVGIDNIRNLVGEYRPMHLDEVLGEVKAEAYIPWIKSVASRPDAEALSQATLPFVGPKSFATHG